MPYVKNFEQLTSVLQSSQTTMAQGTSHTLIVTISHVEVHDTNSSTRAATLYPQLTNPYLSAKDCPKK
jgi:hypothetical protein